MASRDEVQIYGANIAGSAWGYENYEAAFEAFQKFYDPAKVNEDKHCIACWNRGKKFNHEDDMAWFLVGYHTFLVREDMMCQILEDCTFELTKKKGMGRAEPKDWIKEQVAAGKELWFTLHFYPNYD